MATGRLKGESRMRFEHQMRYDAPPTEVYEMLTQKSFREAVCQAQHVTDCTVEVAGGEGSLRVRVDQRRPAAGLPGFAKKLVGDEIHIVQEEEWSSPAEGKLDVGIPGKPGHLTGTVTLRPDGDGTLETVTGDLKVNIPLVGGKIETLVADLLTEALQAEQRVGTTWLARA
jgi:uncharacterized protein YndB with AHSA1/START domain